MGLPKLYSAPLNSLKRAASPAVRDVTASQPRRGCVSQSAPHAELACASRHALRDHSPPLRVCAWAYVRVHHPCLSLSEALHGQPSELLRFAPSGASSGRRQRAIAFTAPWRAPSACVTQTPCPAHVTPTLLADSSAEAHQPVRRCQWLTASWPAPNWAHAPWGVRLPMHPSPLTYPARSLHTRRPHNASFQKRKHGQTGAAFAVCRGPAAEGRAARTGSAAHARVCARRQWYWRRAARPRLPPYCTHIHCRDHLQVTYSEYSTSQQRSIQGSGGGEIWWVRGRNSR